VPEFQGESGQFEGAEIIIVGSPDQVHLQIITFGKVCEGEEFMHGNVELVKENDIPFLQVRCK
jgi:hypothetical protein